MSLLARILAKTYPSLVSTDDDVDVDAEVPPFLSALPPALVAQIMGLPPHLRIQLFIRMLDAAEAAAEAEAERQAAAAEAERQAEAEPETEPESEAEAERQAAAQAEL